MKKEKERLLTLYAQLEARREATETHAKMLVNKMWEGFCNLDEQSEMWAGETEKERLNFFRKWLLTSRRVRPGLYTITHALCFTLSLANLKA